MAQQFGHVYAVKFLCGVFDPERISDQQPIEGPVKPGRYATAINVHNPNPRQPVKFQKKAVLLFAGSEPQHGEQFEQPRPPAPPHLAQLGPDEGLEIDGADIRQVLLQTPAGPGPQAPVFVKGWVVLEVLQPTVGDSPLDVVAVYTAEPIAPPGAPSVGLTMEVERVPPTLVPL